MPPFRRSAYFLAVAAVCAFGVSLVWRPAPPAPFVGLAPTDIPAQIGSFASQGDYEVAPDVKAALSSANITSRVYSAPSGNGQQNGIDFILIGGTDRSALHDPRSCLVGGGWKMQNDHIEAVPNATDGLTVRSCQAVGGGEGIATGDGYDIAYLYIVDGKIKNEVTEIRAEMLISALLGRKNRPVYFLRLMQPLSSDAQTQAANHAHLMEFAGQVWKSLKPRLLQAG